MGCRGEPLGGTVHSVVIVTNQGAQVGIPHVHLELGNRVLLQTNWKEEPTTSFKSGERGPNKWSTSPGETTRNKTGGSTHEIKNSIKSRERGTNAWIGSVHVTLTRVQLMPSWLRTGT